MIHFTQAASTLILSLTATIVSIILLSPHLSTTRLRQISPSTTISRYYRNRHEHHPSRRSLSLLSGLQDPKTVELRTITKNIANIDGIPPPHPGLLRDSSSGTAIPPLTMSPPNLKPYTVEDAILSASAFRDTLFFFVYDASSDTFFVVHNKPGCTFGCQRIHRVASIVSVALRRNFPERFQGEQDLVIMLSCGDAPRIKRQCLVAKNTNYCGSPSFPPILQFGSVFVNTEYLPSMIAMPQSVRPHLPCFDEWQLSEFGKLKGVCQDIQPTVYDVTSNDDYWDNLIPQVIWRGSDFMFLHTMFPGLRQPNFELDLAQVEQEWDGNKSASEYEKKRWAIETLWGMGDEKLLPRWRGVLMTSEAEMESDRAHEQKRMDGEKQLPWVNIKFAHANVGGKLPVGEIDEYKKLQNIGISCIGDYVSMTDQAKYKYHIDLGGGGGTTWTGTIQKLALPGVLFHHVTPTKDWFHDLLVPWEHYIPIKTDLSDLREKFEWAESNPDEARRISENGTRFVQWMASVEGFGQLYDTFLLAPLRNVIHAYHNPLTPDYEGKRALDVIVERGNGEFAIVSSCSGLRVNSCAESRKY